MEKEDKSKQMWERLCYVPAAGVGVVLFRAWMKGCFDVVCGLMFGYFILWQVIRGLVIRRYFWHIGEEKVSFGGLLAAWVAAMASYWLCCK